MKQKQLVFVISSAAYSEANGTLISTGAIKTKIEEVAKYVVEDCNEIVDSFNEGLDKKDQFKKASYAQVLRKLKSKGVQTALKNKARIDILKTPEEMNYWVTWVVQAEFI